MSFLLRVVFVYDRLASGALALREALGRIRRNRLDPVSMAIVGHLAVDQSWQGRASFVALPRDAVERTRAASLILGIRGLLAHALSERAVAFYARHGFVPSPTNPLTLVLSLKRMSVGRTIMASAHGDIALIGDCFLAIRDRWQPDFTDQSANRGGAGKPRARGCLGTSGLASGRGEKQDQPPQAVRSTPRRITCIGWPAATMRARLVI